MNEHGKRRNYDRRYHHPAGETLRSGRPERAADMPRFYDSLRAMLETIQKDYPRVNVMTLIGDHTSSHVYYANSSGTRFENRSGL